MTKELWQRYAEAWSLPQATRRARLAEVAVPNVTYMDPNTSLTGAGALSDYMAAFQGDVPGGRFVITDAYAHHGQTLAHWQMLGPDDAVLMRGTSHARLAADGKFASFAGFFGGPDG